MKKFIYSLIAMITMSISMVNAQNHIEGSTLYDNWFVGASVGASAPQSHAFDWAQHSSWIQLYRPNVALELGKNLTPITTLSVSDEARINTIGAKTMFDTNYMWGNVRLNLSNLWSAYRDEPRKFEVSAGPSIGWMHLFDTKGLPHTNYVAYRATVSFDWNVGNEKQWQINVRPNVTYVDRFRAHNGTVGVNVGMTYKFRGLGSKSHNFVRCNRVYTLEEYGELVNKNVGLEAEVNRLKGALEECHRSGEQKDNVIKNLNAEAMVVESDTLPQAVYFDKDKAVISATMENVIADLAEYLVASPSVKVFVNGYADKETGSAKHNLELSEVRANNVSAILQKYGVDASRITVQAKGDTEQPFASNDKNRVVLALINMN